MITPTRPTLSSLATLVLLASCGGGDDVQSTTDGGVADRPVTLEDAPPPVDARPADAAIDARQLDAQFPPGTDNPDVLWIAGINGSESNIRLQGFEPQHF
jgi:hypothetical protein